MKTPVFLLSAVLASILAMQGWMLIAIVDLKVKVAEIAVRVSPKP